jgi:hypothetical protein
MDINEDRLPGGKKRFPDLVVSAGLETLRPALAAILFLLSIMVPVSFGLLILEESGVLAFIARFLNPLMHLLGLRGEAALVFLSSIFLNIYSAVAAIGALDLTVRELTILSAMCLVAHNFFTECLVMKKTGSSISKMFFLRLFGAVAVACIMNLILPPETAAPEINTASTPEFVTPLVYTITFHVPGRLPAIFFPWLVNTLFLSLRISLIVFAVMFAQRLLDTFGIMKFLARIMAPFMGLLGLPANTAYLWIVTNLVGFVYGSGVLLAEVKSGAVSRSEADLFNHHAALSHSHIEENIIFMSLGAPLFWIALPRFIAAVAAVWLERIRRALFRRSFRVKIVN